jgi:undecaprenyl-diphosphatase
VGDLTNVQGFILGLIQGLTEFLPISSSAHLALSQRLMGLGGETPAMLVLDVVVHLATVAAMGVVFGATFWRYLTRLMRELSPGFQGARVAWRVAALGVLASIPTALFGLAFKKQIEADFGSVRNIALELAFTGVLLWITGYVPRPKRGWRRFGWWRALLVGVAQAVAIIPGISRSGSTICVALYLGLKRRWAGEFSFFLAAPAILGAAALELKDHSGVLSSVAQNGGWRPLGFAALTAFVSGTVALQFLLRTIRRGKLQYFSYYCWLVAIVTLWLTR